jgi:hypothetical protein
MYINNFFNVYIVKVPHPVHSDQIYGVHMVNSPTNYPLLSDNPDNSANTDNFTQNHEKKYIDL